MGGSRSTEVQEPDPHGAVVPTTKIARAIQGISASLMGYPWEVHPDHPKMVRMPRQPWESFSTNMHDAENAAAIVAARNCLDLVWVALQEAEEFADVWLQAAEQSGIGHGGQTDSFREALRRLEEHFAQ